MKDFIRHPNLFTALANVQSIVLECDRDTTELSPFTLLKRQEAYTQ